MAFSPAVRFSWTPSLGLSDTGIPNPVATAGNTVGSEIMYQVTATDSAGCKGEGYVKIKIYDGPALYVPTGFSPNTDGLNERFKAKAVGIKSYHYFRVYNRWGQLMFSSKDPSEGWDGKLSGKEQPSGIYVWMIEAETVNGKLITKKGTVTLIR
jgi:gliding motility-associated-like protein